MSRQSNETYGTDRAWGHLRPANTEFSGEAPSEPCLVRCNSLFDGPARNELREHDSEPRQVLLLKLVRRRLEVLRQTSKPFLSPCAVVEGLDIQAREGGSDPHQVLQIYPL